MGKVLDNISEFDPGYRDKLEALLLEASPQLTKAEKVLLGNHLTGAPMEEMSLADCVQVVAKAVLAVPDYEVAFYDLDDDGVESEVPARVVRWRSAEIARDRFFYLFRHRAGIIPA